jgi:hypothetical protein
MYKKSHSGAKIGGKPYAAKVFFLQKRIGLNLTHNSSTFCHEKNIISYQFPFVCPDQFGAGQF